MYKGFALGALAILGGCALPAPGGQKLVNQPSKDDCSLFAKALGAPESAGPSFCNAFGAMSGSQTIAPASIVKKGGTFTSIQYPSDPKQWPMFDATLSYWLKSYYPDVVEISPVGMGADDLRHLKPPYEPSPLNVWLANVTKHDGKVCFKNNNQAAGLAMLLWPVAQGLINVVSNAVSNHNAQRIYDPVARYNAVILYNGPNPNGPGNDQITAIQFQPKSVPLTCEAR